MTDRKETAAALALLEACRRLKTHWHALASMIEEAGGAGRLVEGGWSATEGFSPSEVRLLVREAQSSLDSYAEMAERLGREGVRVFSVLDPNYPANLREVYNRPPVLFVRGQLLPQDERSVAVVGTRSPSPAGRDEAHHLAAELVGRGITVLSGLARGIDTAAHEAALGATGRTVAVMGTGINVIYPAENAELARKIVATGGALVSQFAPDAPPTRYSFPTRNAVMSGMAIGTAVVEAGPTSGAKMQARLALDHGKRLFLLESLVASQPWAREYAQRPGAVVVRSVEEIISLVETLTSPVRELSLF